MELNFYCHFEKILSPSFRGNEVTEESERIAVATKSTLSGYRIV